MVLFWALDRFTREGALETLQHLNELSNHGVAYRSYTEAYLDSCGLFKDAIVAILGTIAQLERVRISQRVRAGLQRAKLKGTRSGNPVGRPKAVFNWDLVVKLRDEGKSWREIARLCAAGVATIRRAYQNAKQNRRS